MNDGRALLLILDGAGYRTDPDGNAVTEQSLPTIFTQMQEAGFGVLGAAGTSVGLEEGQVGNSEAGHLNIGAGEVVPSLARRLMLAYEDGSWAKHSAWQPIAAGGSLHIVGLLSDAGVHALHRTIIHASEIAANAGTQEIVVHPVLDGFDSQQGSAPRLLVELAEALRKIPQVKLGVVQGRQHFCDRSGDLEVSRVAGDALTGAKPLAPFDPEDLKQHLAAGHSEATYGAHLHPGGRLMRPQEAVLLTSHRADRARQIGAVLSQSQPLYTILDLGDLAGQNIPTQAVFFPQPPRDRGLAFELLRHQIPSARIAEKCKFPHVTHFLNGFDPSLEGEGTCIHSIPEGEIPKRPEMSSSEITDRIIAAMQEPGRRAIVANIANLDQVGHTGDLDLCLRAATTVDRCYQRLLRAARDNGFTILLTADHGNADVMRDADGRPFGSHTDRPVPFLIQPAPAVNLKWRQRDGNLSHVSATFLEALGVTPPDWMDPSLASLRAHG